MAGSLTGATGVVGALAGLRAPAKADSPLPRRAVLPGISSDGTRAVPSGATDSMRLVEKVRVTSGPAWSGYEDLATAKRGDVVYPIATYVGYVKVSTSAG